MGRFFDALGRAVVRYRWLVVVVWILGSVIAIRSLPSLGSQVDNNNGAFLPASAPSNQAAVLAEPLIGKQTHSQVPIVAVTSNATLDSADQTAINNVRARLEKVPTKLSANYLGTSPNDKAAQLLFVSSASPFDQSKSKTLVEQSGVGRRERPLPSRPSGPPRRPGGHQRGQPGAVQPAGQEHPGRVDPLHPRPALHHLPLAAGAARHPAAGRARTGGLGVVHRRRWAAPGSSRSPSSPRSS